MIRKILQKYDLYRRDYYFPNDEENPLAHLREDKVIHELENRLQEKWKDHIPKGWYGFNMAGFCPESFLLAVDEFLEYIKTLDPNFELHQAKIKFGGLRLYLNYRILKQEGTTTNENGEITPVYVVDEEKEEFIDLQIQEMEEQLYDKKLVY